MIIDVQALADQRLLFRYLIDNALSDQAGLSDNELVAFLMTAQGFNQAKCAVLIPYLDWESRDACQVQARTVEALCFRKSARQRLNDVPFCSGGRMQDEVYTTQ
jgi:hypothetical protein